MIMINHRLLDMVLLGKSISREKAFYCYSTTSSAFYFTAYQTTHWTEVNYDELHFGVNSEMQLNF